MIESLIFFIFSALFFIVLFNNMRLSINISSITKQLLQSEIDKNVLVKKLVEVSEINQIKKDDSSEAFLKFISDSRDVAYQYIEDVQSVLNKFIKDIEPEIDYFKEYGDVSAMAPNYYSMKKIVNSYQELKVLLPKDMVE
jgi:hypothetical protein